MHADSCNVAPTEFTGPSSLALLGPGTTMKGSRMQPSEVKTAADAKNIVGERKLTHVKLGVFDADGVLRGKYLAREKFEAALDRGFGFCDVVLGWDSSDQLYDNVGFTGWHTAYPDAQCAIVPETCRALPLEGDMLLFLAEFAPPAEALCPRGTLKRVLARAKNLGYSAQASAEYEFFLFEETPHSVREKNFRNLRTITPGYFGYSLLRASVHAEFYEDLLKLCEAMRFPLEGLHTETGPGVVEAAITYADALEAADRAALFKTYTKILAERRGWMATFMAKWSRDWPGQSGHLHISLQDKRAGSAKSQRVEYRIAAADINPYIALAAAIGSGIWGIEHQIEPDAPIVGNAYAQTYPQARRLPRTLWDAAQRLKQSQPARALFGDAFVEHYAATREWEEREFRKAITDWELARYFEIV